MEFNCDIDVLVEILILITIKADGEVEGKCAHLISW